MFNSHLFTLYTSWEKSLWCLQKIWVLKQNHWHKRISVPIHLKMLLKWNTTYKWICPTRNEKSEQMLDQRQRRNETEWEERGQQSLLWQEPWFACEINTCFKWMSALSVLERFHFKNTGASFKDSLLFSSARTSSPNQFMRHKVLNMTKCVWCNKDNAILIDLLCFYCYYKHWLTINNARYHLRYQPWHTFFIFLQSAAVCCSMFTLRSSLTMVNFTL